MNEMLRELRMSIGKTQLQLASLVNCHQPEICDAERGRPIRRVAMKKIAEFFELPIRAIFDEESNDENE